MRGTLRPVSQVVSPCGMAIGVATLVWASGASAISINTGNPDLSVRWDNTVRYNLGVRVEDQDQRLMRNPSYDDGDSKFDQGDIVTNRLDLLSEIDVNYKGDYGARLSAAAWYDKAYDDTSVESPAGAMTGYNGDRYNSTVERYVNGPSAEFLDAFVWSNFYLGDAPVNVKLGRQTNLWGEGLLLGGHAISYGQAPIDGVKAVSSPGIETKEVFLPVEQLSVKVQATDDLTLLGQYYFGWDPTRVPHGGTYLMGADISPEVDRLPNGIARVESKEPGNTGNWGVGAKLNVEELESSFGLYYREFNDYNPETGIQLLNGGADGFRFVYPEDIRLIGLSAARVIGPVSVGAEISYRKNSHLNSSTIYTATDTGAKGNTWHAVVNGVYLLPKTWFSDTGSVVAELAYSRLDKVTENANLYRGEGYAGCSAGDTACSTTDFWQAAVNFTPQYLNVFPSWDLSVPMSVNYGISGVAPTGGGGFEGALSWSVGAQMNYASRHEFSLKYSDRAVDTTYSPDGSVATGGRSLSSAVGATDRGWLVFTYKTAF